MMAARTIDAVAQRYGVRPSQLVRGPVYDMCFDLEVAAKAETK